MPRRMEDELQVHEGVVLRLDLLPQTSQEGAYLFYP
jgi:hypothetical protein